MSIRVLLADDHGAIRAGLAMILDGADDITVVGEAADGRTSINQVRALRPDVVPVSYNNRRRPPKGRVEIWEGAE
uniref:Response regulatory domain-containing protein n=1 Tax=Thermocrispum agreste TaxID=37925 RepID=A0A2W4J6J9_9PSEU|nr:MAG: hypothetical protein DIU77_15000 [Thermocrispum agreste]